MYEVPEGRTQVGTLDTAFVESLEAPIYFTIASRLWKAERVDFENHAIKAKKAKEGMAPKWSSFGGPDTPLETAQRVGEFLYGHRSLPSFLDESSLSTLRSLCQDGPTSTGWSPQSLEYVHIGNGKATVRTYAGDKLNRTLARLLESQGLKTSWNYASVTVEKGPSDPGKLRNQVCKVVTNLVEATWSDDFIEILNRNQKAWPFSPFVPMVPNDLAH
ncbi:hypothetical protein IC757_13250 [Wenzhouxiangella sp. AB-CW3]|uniref:hypothetical protein n=1 Tax=Wenzhouxiangella sp. AB-CW3 TaxID=2771012 RepID=UPI00168B133C|nr:hypothetical protein [Wenzhouxiangella sp. AB-CW3]QOC21984.1 hypothetical protein IC757_13250 [Wenzhouxiangella sp. AB-CW3]